MTDYSMCRKFACGTRVDGTVKTCPDCGGVMMGSAWMKQTGWIMIIVGALLGIAGIFLVLSFLPAMMDPQAAVDSGTVALTVEQVPMAMGMLVLLTGFGLSLLFFGFQRAIRSIRSAMAKPMILGLGIAFLAVMLYFGNALPDTPTAAGVPASEIR